VDGVAVEVGLGARGTDDRSSWRSCVADLSAPYSDVAMFLRGVMSAEGDLGAELYLDLLKQVLTRQIAPDRYRKPGPSTLRSNRLARIAYPLIDRVLSRFNLALCLSKFDADRRAQGRDWPGEAETMIGSERLDNLHYCVRKVLTDRVPGDFIETGAWRGGACIFMRAALKAYGDTSKCVWVADSFEGLPEPDRRYPGDLGSVLHKFSDVLGVSLDRVAANFTRYGLLDEQVRFLKGWFRDTLPKAPINSLAILRLDGDLYSSTMDALENLYPKLSPGGYLIVDDYGAIGMCKKAVDDYRHIHGVTEAVEEVDWSGIFWQKKS
jgi:O-methyltransferase